MQAKLTTGEIIELVQDCDCTTHNGPHWLFILDYDKEQISQMLARGEYYRHINESMLYLERKEQAMITRNIEEIIR